MIKAPRPRQRESISIGFDRGKCCSSRFSEPLLFIGAGGPGRGQVPTSVEKKTVGPERSPIDSPCQNVEKSSSDGAHNSVPPWGRIVSIAQDEWV